MDYEKAYKDALSRAKDCYVNKKISELDDNAQQLCEYIFPELVESEDERIRKWIIDFIEVRLDGAGEFINNYKNAIAWLEKQDTKKFEEELEKAYKCADKVQYKKGYEDAKKKLEKQGEKKPAWSKEDITNYSKVLFCLQTLTFPTDDERKELITWLKKECEPQPHWKPTKEQMNALKQISENDYVMYNTILKSLYNDLKKL